MRFGKKLEVGNISGQDGELGESVLWFIEDLQELSPLRRGWEWISSIVDVY